MHAIPEVMSPEMHRPSLLRRLWKMHANLQNLLNKLAPLADLALRLYVANVFWVSGMTKVSSWDSTLQLFEYEYHVPLLSPTLAAYSGTFTELFFPVLLVLGVGGRIPALILFVFNIIAVISYPDLNAVGLEQHKTWGVILAVLLCHGHGPISLDGVVRKVLTKHK